MTEIIKEYNYQITDPKTGNICTNKVIRKYTKKDKVTSPLRDLEPNEVRKIYEYHGRKQIRVYKVKKIKST
jgi:hypothetical protein